MGGECCKSDELNAAQSLQADPNNKGQHGGVSFAAKPAKEDGLVGDSQFSGEGKTAIIPVGGTWLSAGGYGNTPVKEALNYTVEFPLKNYSVSVEEWICKERHKCVPIVRLDRKWKN